jgi:hypothetical protein
MGVNMDLFTAEHAGWRKTKKKEKYNEKDKLGASDFKIGILSSFS